MLGAWEGPQCLSLPEGDAAHPPGTPGLIQKNSREQAREEILSLDFSIFSARSSIPLLAGSHLLENSANIFLASVQKSFDKDTEICACIKTKIHFIRAEPQK